MVFRGVCLGGPQHGRQVVSENDTLGVLHIDEGAVFAADAETLLPTTHRTGRYVHRQFRTTSGQVVGVWDWEGWLS